MPQRRWPGLVLLLAPLAISAWFVQDGGLSNGLNRLVYEICMGLFLTAYALLLGLIQKLQPHARLDRLARLSALAAGLWTLAVLLYENL